MVTNSRYRSPIGELILSADEVGLTGLYFADKIDSPQAEFCETPTIVAASAAAQCVLKRPLRRSFLHFLRTIIQRDPLFVT